MRNLYTGAVKGSGFMERPIRLRRQLNMLDVTSLVVGAIIGADIYIAAALGAKLSFHSIDALHIAGAEEEKCDVFLTTDAQSIEKYRTNQNRIRVRIANPVNWLQEVI